VVPPVAVPPVVAPPVVVPPVPDAAAVAAAVLKKEREAARSQLQQNAPAADEPLGSRCLKVTFGSEKPPKKQEVLDDALKTHGVVCVRAVLRKKSAILMFASATAASDAAENIHAETTWHAAVVDAPGVAVPSAAGTVCTACGTPFGDARRASCAKCGSVRSSIELMDGVN
jgi:hypothetical protein